MKLRKVRQRVLGTELIMSQLAHGPKSAWSPPTVWQRPLVRTNTGFCFPSRANHWSTCSGFLFSSGEPGKLIYGQCDQKCGESCPKLVLKSTCSFPLMVERKKESSEDVEGDRATGRTEFGSLSDFAELSLSATPPGLPPHSALLQIINQSLFPVATTD